MAGLLESNHPWDVPAPALEPSPTLGPTPARGKMPGGPRLGNGRLGTHWLPRRFPGGSCQKPREAAAAKAIVWPERLHREGRKRLPQTQMPPMQLHYHDSVRHPDLEGPIRTKWSPDPSPNPFAFSPLLFGPGLSSGPMWTLLGIGS